jgi:hypothetical protein
MPWGIIMMVCGGSVLIGVLEKTGGMELFTSLLASGVTVVNQRRDCVRDGRDLDLQQHVRRGDAGVFANDPEPRRPARRRRSAGDCPLDQCRIIVVDVSPLSTIGALAVAAVSDQQQSRELSRQLMTWGLSMTIIGAGLCQLFAGALARA